MYRTGIHANLLCRLRPQLFVGLHIISNNFGEKIKIKIDLGPKMYDIFIHLFELFVPIKFQMQNIIYYTKIIIIFKFLINIQTHTLY